MPRQRRSAARPILEMAREDAASRGLMDGSLVEIRNGGGSIRAHLAVVEEMHRGVVALPGKWWNADAAGAVNDLTSLDRSPSGQPAYNETFVEVASVSEMIRSIQ